METLQEVIDEMTEDDETGENSSPASPGTTDKTKDDGGVLPPEGPETGEFKHGGQNSKRVSAPAISLNRTITVSLVPKGLKRWYLLFYNQMTCQLRP